MDHEMSENKKRFALTVGVFDCFHNGHANLLQKMRDAAEHVVVILHDDVSTYKNKRRFTVQKLEHRLSNLYASGLVDSVTVTYSADPHTELRRAIETMLGHANCNEIVYMRGDDWQEFPGKYVLEEYGVPVEYVPYTKTISTTKIRNGFKL